MCGVGVGIGVWWASWVAQRGDGGGSGGQMRLVQDEVLQQRAEARGSCCGSSAICGGEAAGGSHVAAVVVWQCGGLLDVRVVVQGGVSAHRLEGWAARSEFAAVRWMRRRRGRSPRAAVYQR
jgi:hypothetical protein